MCTNTGARYEKNLTGPSSNYDEIARRLAEQIETLTEPLDLNVYERAEILRKAGAGYLVLCSMNEFHPELARITEWGQRQGQPFVKFRRSA